MTPEPGCLFAERVVRLLGADRVRFDAPLGPLTTFKVGGPADVLLDVRSIDELQRVADAGREDHVSLTIIGGGSNVLVSDAGVRGAVLRLRMSAISQPSNGRVRAEAGATMNGLVRWTVARGLAGLEAWAGTPGTVGGAIHGNAHYGGRNISEFVTAACVVSMTGACEVVPVGAMAFAYDTSRVAQTGEMVAWAEFRVAPGVPEALRAVARASLAHRKRTQPLNVPSAGCIFQNPDSVRDQLPEGVPWSAGALVDRAGLKGARVGGAAISSTHANFIVNDGTATAGDVHALIDQARHAVREAFGVELREEVVYLGDWPCRT